MSEVAKTIADLEALRVIPCAKAHEASPIDISRCPHRRTNLVCGHPEFVSLTLQNAQRIAENLGFESPLIRGLPTEIIIGFRLDAEASRLDDFALDLYSLDGNTPAAREEVRAQERAFGEEMLEVRNALLSFLRSVSA